MIAPDLHRTAVCLRQRLRTSWPVLAGIVAVTAAPIVGTAASISSVYASDAQREIYETTVGHSVASIAMNGRGYGLREVGGITAYEAGIFTQLILPILVLVVALRFTRGDEDSGRLELVTARPVGRLAPPAAAVLAILSGIVVAAAVTAAGLVAVGLPVAGSLWYASSLAAMMAFFVAVGVVAAQIGGTLRSGTSLALGAFGLAYLMRLVVDARQLDAVWLSPLGWAAQVRPYADPSAGPVLAYLVGTLLGLGLAAILAGRRDLGAGLVAERRGPARGRLAGVGALQWRLTRGGLVGWLIGAVAWGASLGGVAREMVAMLAANPALAEAMSVRPGHESDLLMTLSAQVVALIAAAAGIAVAGRLAAEETSGRTGWVLAAPVPRWRWQVSGALTALGQVLAVGLLGAVALGVAARWSSGDVEQPWLAVRAVLAGMPGAALLTIAAVLASAVHPRGIALGWAWLGWSLLVTLLGDTLRLPAWARDLSALGHTGQVPAQAFRPVAAVVIGLLAAVVLGASVRLAGRRDLAAG